ncbi:MAG: thymidylate synthase [bacterium]|nr:thymidylate synthase [bacterium]
MKQYLEILKEALEKGDDRMDRTGVGTRAIFRRTMRFDLTNGQFPIVTTKKVFFLGVVTELIWFLKGLNDNRELQKLGVHIWDGNANDSKWKEKAKFDGDLGRVYGVQWRHWQGPGGEVDQIAELLELLKKNPTSRRLLVTAWNPGELSQMALPPCHMFFQCFVRQGKYLDLAMYQRSCDLFLGVPFNISSYALLLTLLARFTNLEPGELIHDLGDAHIYLNHIDQVKQQLSREPLALPRLELDASIKSLDDLQLDAEFIKNKIRLIDYKFHPPIKAPMAV